MNGIIISGTLISGKKYFEKASETVKEASREPNDMASVLGEAWRHYTALYEPPEEAPEDWQPIPASYIQLMNAQFFTPGQSPIPENGTLWRGKLSSVDGFSLGCFSA